MTAVRCSADSLSVRANSLRGASNSTARASARCTGSTGQVCAGAEESAQGKGADAWLERTATLWLMGCGGWAAYQTCVHSEEMASTSTHASNSTWPHDVPFLRSLLSALTAHRAHPLLLAQLRLHRASPLGRQPKVTEMSGPQHVQQR